MNPSDEQSKPQEKQQEAGKTAMEEETKESPKTPAMRFDPTNFLSHFLKEPLKENYRSTIETNRLFILYFIMSSYAVLDKLDRLPFDRKVLIEYIYGFLYVFRMNAQDQEEFCAFLPGSLHRIPPQYLPAESADVLREKIHIVNTYCAICSLLVLGDDLSRIPKDKVLRFLAKHQDSSGNFHSVLGQNEKDLRFLFAVFAICSIFSDFSKVNVPKAIEFILSCQNPNGAFGLVPGLESHGGATYCAIASLTLIGELDQVPRKSELVNWCVQRQISGMQGRVGKVPDSCYSFWIGGTLKMLGLEHLLESQRLGEFILECQHPIGGFCKYPVGMSKAPDPVHTLHSLYGLSIIKFPGMIEIDPKLGLPSNVKIPSKT